MTLALGVMTTDVAPAVEFFAYQMSFQSITAVSTDRAAQASTYALPALSVMRQIVVAGVHPFVVCQPTTIRCPLPVAGIVQLPGNVAGPQFVTFTRLICANAEGEPTDSPAIV